MNKVPDEITPEQAAEPATQQGSGEEAESPADAVEKEQAVEPVKTTSAHRSGRKKKARGGASRVLERIWEPRRWRASYDELPPDYQQEVIGRDQGEAHRRAQNHRPTAPMVSVPTTLHCPEIQRFYVETYGSCNEYAVAMEAVARNRMQDRGAFEKYMAEFDQHLNGLSNYARKIAKKLERESNGGMSDSPTPMTFSTKLQSARSKRFLDSLTLLDDAARHASFLAIYGEMDERTYLNTINAIKGRITQAARGLQSVKRECFREMRASDTQRHQVIAQSQKAGGGQKRKVTRSGSSQPTRAAGMMVENDEGESAS